MTVGTIFGALCKLSLHYSDADSFCTCRDLIIGQTLVLLIQLLSTRVTFGKRSLSLLLIGFNKKKPMVYSKGRKGRWDFWVERGELWERVGRICQLGREE